MLKSCGARGVDVASLAITVEKVRRAKTLWAGAGVPHGLIVEGMDIENLFV